MATTIEELEAAIVEASAGGFRGRLLARGQARSIIWRGGELPPEAPDFAPRLSYDLLSFGFSLLSMGLRVRELEGDADISRQAFELAADAIESVISRGNPEDDRRGFHRVVSASAYHLCRYSARSYSLLIAALDGSNLSPIERALALLILRNFKVLLSESLEWRLGGSGDDQQILRVLEASWQHAVVGDKLEEFDAVEALDLALTDNFQGALAIYLLAFDWGDRDLVETALHNLRSGLSICAELNLVPQWWVYRLTIHLLDDLWSSSFHAVLPKRPIGGNENSWRELRHLYLALLSKRSRAEVDLWPSQLEGASRAVDGTDDLVVSLPTSAGKTRIAELCILRCLSEGKRIIFVTPLRALSAQTETSLRHTFLPLGKTVSTLYGSIGTSDLEQDVLRKRDIVVATPEKLDFALRNDPSIIDDVGLVVLDEGHMIGLGEREVRYEVQVQRLLRRSDADFRRIVCLSAVLPNGEQLDDFVSWLRRDKDGASVQAAWRPTRLRYGEVVWEHDHARLDLLVGDERPFVPYYFPAITPTAEMRRSDVVGVRQVAFPRNQRELVLATAWKLVEEGQSVLIYCPERRSVEPYARAIVDLYLRGLIKSVFNAGRASIATARSIAQEWLGEEHPIVECLDLGVAIHHGALPTPLRKEVEKLLRDGILKITVSSPTLAQGLNLSATAVVMHDVEYFDMTTRKRELIKASDFHNIIGRAGRAYVDIEGLVLYPMFNSIFTRRFNWAEVIAPDREREMESGLVRLVCTLLIRLHELLEQPPIEEMVEYVVNNADAWVFRSLENETEEDQDAQKRLWETHLTSLDTAVLSLLGDSGCAVEEIAIKLDEALDRSLWERGIARYEEGIRNLLRQTVESRARFIWERTSDMQRRGYFLAGVGYDSGSKLDSIADEVNELLVRANDAILLVQEEDALTAITTLAERLFSIPPFVPEPLPTNWREITQAWLKGEALGELAAENATEVLQFVEGGLVYRLPWGMEAIRVRALAHGDVIDSLVGDLTLEEYEVGVAVPAVECGTLNRSAALLMQAGFTSRLGAITAAEDAGVAFTNTVELSAWLGSEEAHRRTAQENWPTAETAEQWRSFVASFRLDEKVIWKEQRFRLAVDWNGGPIEGEKQVRLIVRENEETVVVAPDGQRLGQLRKPIAQEASGLMLANVSDDLGKLELIYFGPDDLRI